jgi:hypothetical protein
LSTGEVAVVNKFPEIMNIWADMGSDTAEEDGSVSFIRDEREKCAFELTHCAEKRRKDEVSQLMTRKGLYLIYR